MYRSARQAQVCIISVVSFISCALYRYPCIGGMRKRRQRLRAIAMKRLRKKSPDFEELADHYSNEELVEPEGIRNAGDDEMSTLNPSVR